MSIIVTSGLAGSPKHLFASGKSVVDTVVQLDVFGSSIRAWMWPYGESMPKTPQFDLRNDVIVEAGSIAVSINNGFSQIGSNNTGIFRYVHVAGTPIHELPVGDVDGDGTLSISDLDSVASARNSSDGLFDLNGDGRVDLQDVTFWVHDVAKTFLGDAKAVPEGEQPAGSGTLGRLNCRYSIQEVTDERVPKTDEFGTR